VETSGFIKQNIASIYWAKEIGYWAKETGYWANAIVMKMLKNALLWKQRKLMIVKVEGVSVCGHLIIVT